MEKESNRNMIIGRTGCGMSFRQTREMSMEQGNIVISDPKGELGLNGLKGQTENCCAICNTGKDGSTGKIKIYHSKGEAWLF